MSLLVGVPLGTVKARLHRARTLLRQALEHIGIRAQTLVQGVDKEDSMIEVIVHDVILWVCMGARVHEVDARPSDAINLALRLRVPIFVDPVVFARASLSPESVLSEAEAQY